MAAADALAANTGGAHMWQQEKKLGRTARRQQLATETADRSPDGGKEHSIDEDWVHETERTASKQLQVHRNVYKVTLKL